MLAFSASPLPYITTVGEHLLPLPQLLLPFSGGDVLADIQPELCPAAASARALVEGGDGTAAAEDEAREQRHMRPSFMRGGGGGAGGLGGGGGCGPGVGAGPPATFGAGPFMLPLS